MPPPMPTLREDKEAAGSGSGSGSGRHRKKTPDELFRITKSVLEIFPVQEEDIYALTRWEEKELFNVTLSIESEG